MCRWLAYSGSPVLLEDLLYKPKHSLIDQSLHSTMGAETTNGDGFGVGWYGTGDGPGVYRSVAPAWGDANLRHLARHIESPLFLSHVRATSGTAIQETNCHPFGHGAWLFVHNGVVGDFRALRRDLMLLVDPALFPDIQGATDTEVVFHLALTHGLEVGAIQRGADRGRSDINRQYTRHERILSHRQPWRIIVNDAAPGDHRGRPLRDRYLTAKEFAAALL